MTAFFVKVLASSTHVTFTVDAEIKSFAIVGIKLALERVIFDLNQEGLDERGREVFQNTLQALETTLSLVQADLYDPDDLESFVTAYQNHLFALEKARKATEMARESLQAITGLVEFDQPTALQRLRDERIKQEFSLLNQPELYSKLIEVIQAEDCESATLILESLIGGLESLNSRVISQTISTVGLKRLVRLADFYEIPSPSSPSAVFSKYQSLYRGSLVLRPEGVDRFYQLMKGLLVVFKSMLRTIEATPPLELLQSIEFKLHRQLLEVKTIPKEIVVGLMNCRVMKPASMAASEKSRLIAEYKRIIE